MIFLTKGKLARFWYIRIVTATCMSWIARLEKSCRRASSHRSPLAVAWISRPVSFSMWKRRSPSREKWCADCVPRHPALKTGSLRRFPHVLDCSISRTTTYAWMRRISRLTTSRALLMWEPMSACMTHPEAMAENSPPGIQSREKWFGRFPIIFRFGAGHSPLRETSCSTGLWMDGSRLSTLIAECFCGNSKPGRVLRTPRGLHHLPSRSCHYFNSGGVLLAASHLRLHADCGLGRSYGIYRVQRLGPPHVCHGLASVERKLLYRRELNDCDTHRNPVLLLGRDPMVRAASGATAHALVLRIFLCFLDRWIVGSHAGFRARRFAGPRYLLRCRALSMC